MRWLYFSNFLFEHNPTGLSTRRNYGTPQPGVFLCGSHGPLQANLFQDHMSGGRPPSGGHCGHEGISISSACSPIPRARPPQARKRNMWPSTLFVDFWVCWKVCFPPLLRLSRRVGGPHFAHWQRHSNLRSKLLNIHTWNQETIGRDHTHIGDVKSSFILPDQGPSIDPTFFSTWDQSKWPKSHLFSLLCRINNAVS